MPEMSVSEAVAIMARGARVTRYLHACGMSAAVAIARVLIRLGAPAAALRVLGPWTAGAARELAAAYSAWCEMSPGELARLPYPPPFALAGGRLRVSVAGLRSSWHLLTGSPAPTHRVLDAAVQVLGAMEAAHRRTGIRSDIIHAYSAWCEMSPGDVARLPSPPPFLRAGGRLRVSVAGLRRSWQLLTGSPAPTHRAMAAALQRLSSGGPSHWVYEIDPAVLE